MVLHISKHMVFAHHNHWPFTFAFFGSCHCVCAGSYCQDFGIEQDTESLEKRFWLRKRNQLASITLKQSCLKTLNFHTFRRSPHLFSRHSLIFLRRCPRSQCHSSHRVSSWPVGFHRNQSLDSEPKLWANSWYCRVEAVLQTNLEALSNALAVPPVREPKKMLWSRWNESFHGILHKWKLEH